MFENDIRRIRSGLNPALRLFGLLLFVAGSLVMCLLLFRRVEAPATGNLLGTLHLWSIVPVLGLILLMWRRGLTLDRLSKQAVSWWGLIVPFRETVYPLSNFTQVSLSRSFTSKSEYRVQLSGPGVTLPGTGVGSGYREARQIAEELAGFLKLEFRDAPDTRQTDGASSMPMLHATTRNRSAQYVCLVLLAGYGLWVNQQAGQLELRDEKPAAQKRPAAHVRAEPAAPPQPAIRTTERAILDALQARARHPAYQEAVAASRGRILHWSARLPEDEQLFLALQAAIAERTPPQAEPLSIPRIKTSPVLDGDLGEGEWAGALSMPIGGDDNGTTMRLASDGRWLFVAVDVPSDTDLLASGQFRIHFHPGVSPLLEYIGFIVKGVRAASLIPDGSGGMKLHRTDVRGKPPRSWEHVSGFSSFNALRFRAPPSEPAKEAMAASRVDNSHLRYSLGRSAVWDHRQYEAAVLLRDAHIEPGRAFAAHGSVFLYDEKYQRTTQGEFGSARAPVWFVVAGDTPAHPADRSADLIHWRLPMGMNRDAEGTDVVRIKAYGRQNVLTLAAFFNRDPDSALVRRAQQDGSDVLTPISFLVDADADPQTGSVPQEIPAESGFEFHVIPEYRLESGQVKRRVRMLDLRSGTEEIFDAKAVNHDTGKRDRQFLVIEIPYSRIVRTAGELVRIRAFQHEQIFRNRELSLSPLAELQLQ